MDDDSVTELRDAMWLYRREADLRQEAEGWCRYWKFAAWGTLAALTLSVGLQVAEKWPDGTQTVKVTPPGCVGVGMDCCPCKLGEEKR